MVIFTDGSTQGSPGPEGTGIVIKKQGLQKLNLQRQSLPMSGESMSDLKNANT